MPISLRLLARFACAVALAIVLSPHALVLAHEGHDHGEEKQVSGVPASPRVVAVSERYQLVGIAEGEVLVIYLDRAEDNAPVTNASLEVTIDGETFKAEPQHKNVTYEVTAPAIRAPGDHEVLVTIAEGGEHDLLAGTLTIPAREQANTHQHGIRQRLIDAVAALRADRNTIPALGVLLLAAAVGTAVVTRRKMLALPMALVGLFMASALAWAHEGHDHGPDLSASAGNAPSRRPDGTLFVPKPTQRLLEIRTRMVKSETRVRTARFNGRIVANPNRSGVVQSTLQGRYEAPQGGVPPLGTRVKAGDLLGRVSPSFQSIDTSEMGQTLGTLDQEIALNRRKLARQEELLAKNVVARAVVEDVRIQLEGLERRRKDLLATKVRPDDLRAPVDGVIAATRVVAGQVVAPTDQRFQIIDPASLLVEALVFDQVNPDAVDEATATVGPDASIKLKFLGRSRALQQQYSILQFQILDTKVPLNTGTPVTVIAETNERVAGIVLPRASLAQAPNGQTVVFAHREPELFVPRPVRFDALDGENVLITAGIAAGDKIVVRNAPLLNQVR